jgi:hypothetical protein
MFLQLLSGDLDSGEQRQQTRQEHNCSDHTHELRSGLD